MIQINLLPWREQRKKQQQTRFGVVVAMFVGFGVFVTVFFHMHYSAKIKHQEARNVMLQTSLDREAAELTTLNKQRKEMIDVDDQLHFIYNLRDTSFRAVRLLNELAIVNPEAVTLFKIIRAGNEITVFGKAKSNLQITLFMESIEKSKFFAQPVLTEISGKENAAGEARTFQLKIDQQG